MANIDARLQTMGRYNKGGTTAANGSNIGWWQRTVFPTSADDMVFNLPQKYEGAPDLLSYDVYGTDLLGWFVMQYNNLIDVENEFVTDVTIRLPTKSRLMSQLLSK